MLPGGTDPQMADDSVDLRAYLAVLQRRWQTVALVTGVVVLAAMVLSIRQPEQYRAEAELLIRQSDSASIVGAGPVINVSEAERRLNNEVRLFESGTVEAAVAEVYDGPLDHRKVRASILSETSDVVRVSMTAGNPTAAAELVNLYADTFIEVRRVQQTDEMFAVGEELGRKIAEIDTDLTALPPAQPTEDRAVTVEPASLEARKIAYTDQLQDLELSADIAGSSGAEVLTAATPPGSPISPTPTRDAAIALVLGLVLGVGVAFLIDTLDERIRTSADLDAVAGGLPTLGVIPLVEKGNPVDLMADGAFKSSPLAESVRSLRTAIKFASLDRPTAIIQITSGSQGEGKTTTVANLAMALAQAGERVTVVCCDLRRPSVERAFGLDLVPGLTDVLAGDVELARAIRRYAPNLIVLPAGTPPRNPSELLSSTRTTTVIQSIAADSDVVLLDCTPVLPVADALAVSRIVDATLVVVDSRSTHRKALQRTLQLLHQVRAPIIGTILNGVSESGLQRYGYGVTYGDSYADARRDARRASRAAEWAVPEHSSDPPRASKR